METSNKKIKYNKNNNQLINSAKIQSDYLEKIKQQQLQNQYKLQSNTKQKSKTNNKNKKSTNNLDNGSSSIEIPIYNVPSLKDPVINIPIAEYKENYSIPIYE